MRTVSHQPGAKEARTSRRAQRGIASVLAMLYLVIFSTLAVGFYAAVTMSSQVANNDRRAMEAQVAAESGFQFVRYQLSRVTIPAGVPADKVFENIGLQLAVSLDGKPNLSGGMVGYDGSSISIPGGGTYIDAAPGGGAAFRVFIVPDGERLLTKLVGRCGGGAVQRALQIDFEPVGGSSSIFDYGIVTNGPITMSGGGLIASPTNRLDSNVLSLAQVPTPVVMSGGATIAGDLYMSNPKGAVSTSGSASIGGSTGAAMATHVHAGSPSPVPEMPGVDTSIFLPFVTNTYRPGRQTYTNCLIPAGTNPNFGGTTTIEGVLYIKYPNKVTFSGACIIRGTIVVENGAVASKSNSISFSGGATNYGMETLPDTPDFPPALRALTGSALLAPGFAVTLSGSSGSIGGTMLADSFTLSGGSGGVITGSVIALGTAPMVLSGGASISRYKPTGPPPAGLIFTRTYKPVPETYLEVLP